MTDDFLNFLTPETPQEKDDGGGYLDHRTRIKKITETDNLQDETVKSVDEIVADESIGEDSQGEELQKERAIYEHLESDVKYAIGMEHLENPHFSIAKIKATGTHLDLDLVKAIGGKNLANPNMTVEKIVALGGWEGPDQVDAFGSENLNAQHMGLEKYKIMQGFDSYRTGTVGGYNIVKEGMDGEKLSLLKGPAMEIKKFQYVTGEDFASEFMDLKMIKFVRETDVSYLNVMRGAFLVRPDVTVKKVEFLRNNFRPEELAKIVRQRKMNFVMNMPEEYLDAFTVRFIINSEVSVKTLQSYVEKFKPKQIKEMIQAKMVFMKRIPEEYSKAFGIDLILNADVSEDALQYFIGDDKFPSKIIQKMNKAKLLETVKMMSQRLG